MVFKAFNHENKRRVMLVLEDETSGASFIHVRELNDWLDKDKLISVSSVRVVGNKGNDTEDNVVKRLLPEKEWEFTPSLYRANHPRLYSKRRKESNQDTETDSIKHTKNTSLKKDSDSLPVQETEKGKGTKHSSKKEPTGKNKKRGIILINTVNDEIKQFDSINGAAVFLGTNFSNSQRAALYNGVIKGWRVFEDPQAIEAHIKDLKKQLKILKKLGIE